MTQPAENKPQIDTSTLPDMLADLINVIGLAATARLLERCGGRRIYVPKELRDDHPLTLIIGRTAAGRMVDHYNLSTLEIPMHDTLVRAMRDNEIRKRRAGGECIKTLSEECWLSERQIRNICSEPPQ